MDNHGFRYYDSELGRYLTRDPLGQADGANVYIYVQNNPINKIDPLGLAGYWSEVGDAFLGYGDAIASTAKGVATIVSSPIQSAKGIAHAVSNPKATYNAIKGDILKKSKTTRGQASILGDVLVGVATGGALKAVAKTATVAKVANALNKLTKKSTTATKIVEKTAAASKAIDTTTAKAVEKVKDSVPLPNKTAIKEGIYEFKEVVDGKIKTYVGQSNNVPRRLKEHADAGREIVDGSTKTTSMPGSSKLERELVEHERIQQHTGGVRAKDSDVVSNKVDPIGKKRRKELRKEGRDITEPKKKDED